MSRIADSARTLFGGDERVLIKRVETLRYSQPLMVATLALLATTLCVFLVHAMFRFSIAGSALYVLPVWLAARLDGRRAGIVAVALVTAVITAIDVHFHATAASDAVGQALIRFASFGVVMLVIARVEESMTTARQMATRDPLTGLLNRRGLAEFVEGSPRGRDQDAAVVAMIDCDDFKRINDTYGHVVGDRVLQILARVLEAESRSTDWVVRMGGDEFALVLNHTHFEEAKLVLKRMEESFEAQVRVEGLECSLSVGVSMSRDPSDLNLSLMAADRAMYAAKNLKRATAYLS